LHIIIVGSGKVGFALAQELSQQHDITVVDSNAEALERSAGRLDVNCILGNGANLEILLQAGAASADLIIAAAGSDELNIVVCAIAKSQGARQTVVRIRNPEYTREPELLKNALGISRIINPEYEAALEISRLLVLPVADKVDSFANERVEIVTYTVEVSDRLTGGKTLAQLRLPEQVLICGVVHKGEYFVPGGDFVIREGDVLYLSGTLFGLHHFFKFIGHSSHKAKDIMIIGGSRTAVYLARIAHKMGIRVCIIERDAARCTQLTALLPDCLILCGDGTDEEVLLSEDLKKKDTFVALTDSDEENVLASFYAKKQGVPKVIPKINRQNYLDLTNQLGLESAVCPRLVTANHMFRYTQAIDNTRSRDMQKLYRFANGAAEAIEFIVPQGSRLLGQPLARLRLRKNILIAAIVHGKEVIVPNGKSVIAAGDQVLVLTKNVPLEKFDDILL